jgi:hypothetical protein
MERIEGCAAQSQPAERRMQPRQALGQRAFRPGRCIPNRRPVRSRLTSASRASLTSAMSCCCWAPTTCREPSMRSAACSSATAACDVFVHGLCVHGPPWSGKRAARARPGCLPTRGPCMQRRHAVACKDAPAEPAQRSRSWACACRLVLSCCSLTSCSCVCLSCACISLNLDCCSGVVRRRGGAGSRVGVIRARRRESAPRGKHAAPSASSCARGRPQQEGAPSSRSAPASGACPPAR